MREIEKLKINFCSDIKIIIVVEDLLIEKKERLTLLNYNND